MAQSYRSGLVLFPAFFAVVCVLKAATLWQPPVWDTAMGLFPAAIALAENGFDLPDLLDQPGWLEGGPKLHPFSIVTWITAALLALLGESAALLPVLHGLHFAVAAFTLLGLFRLAAPRLGEGLSLALVAVTLLFPLFSTQTGYLYFELPLALCTVWAAHAGARRAWGAALAWSALACFVKEAGILVPVALGCAAALERQPLQRVAGFAIAPALLVALHLSFGLGGEGFSRPYIGQLGDALHKLWVMPDFAVLLVLFGVSGVLVPSRISLLIVGAFFGFYALLPLAGVDVYVLPRYYVQIVPFVLLGVTELVRHLAGVRGAALALAVLAIFFVLNRSGDFYSPISGNEFSLAERSGEYRDLLAVQRKLVEAGTRVADDTPVLYGLPEHFLFQYPRLGYVEEPPANGHCVWFERPTRAPEHFVALYNFVGYGGGPIRSLVREARRDPGRRVNTTIFEQGRYRTALIKVERVE